MRRTVFIGQALVLVALLGVGWTSAWGFTSVSKVTFSAGATIGAGAAQQPLQIHAVPLDNQAFFGKDVVIGVDVLRTDNQPITTTNLKVNLVYQLADANGAIIGAPTVTNVLLQRSINNPSLLNGTAIVDRSLITSIQTGGSILYYFQAVQGNSATVLSKAGAGVFPAPGGQPDVPTGDYFTTSIINSEQAMVYPAGAVVTLPDTHQFDGHTVINIPAGAVTAATPLSVVRNDISALPMGPGGMSPVVAYTISLESGEQPMRPIQLTLSYPAGLNGLISGTNIAPSSLAAYYYRDGTWQLLGLPNLDSSLHTITGVTTHLTTFALFPVGRVGIADLRTPQRIITPNGDGINDRANFSTVSEVQLFDIHGRRIKSLPGPNPSWDGTDDSGHIVENGVYLYQYSEQGTRITGVIAVAK